MKDNAIDKILAKGEKIIKLRARLIKLEDEISSDKAIKLFDKYVGKTVRVKFLELHYDVESVIEGELAGFNGYTVEIKNGKINNHLRSHVTVGIYIERILDFEICD